MGRLYCVYKLSCNISKKVYIGVTSQPLNKRWRGGKGYSQGTLIRMEIDKFGWDSFSKEILESGLTMEQAGEKEKYYIEKFNSFASGLNSSVGGEVPSEEKIISTSKALSGRKLSGDTRAKMSESRKGYVFTDEHKKHLSEAHIGKPSYWQGRNRDVETNRKISQKLSKPIRCVETGEVFANLKDASQKTGYPVSCISKWCNGVKPKNCRYTFERMV